MPSRSRKKHFLPLLSFLLTLLSLSHAYVLSGSVYIQGTNIPLEKAEVSLQGRQTKTASDGTFTLTNLEQNISTVTIKKKGYNSLSQKISLEPSTPQHFELDLAKIFEAQTQKVYADREKEKISYYKVNKKEVEQLSGSRLFCDPVSSLQMLPGVGSNGSFDSTIYVRGGAGYEVLSVADNIPYYFSNLWGGKLTIFNAHIIDSVDFYPGGFDARYGQALSGIIDFHYKEGPKQTSATTLDISITEFNLLYTTPLEKDKQTIWLAFRRSYYDIIGNSLSSSQTPLELPYFQIMDSKYTWYLDDLSKINLQLSVGEEGMKVPGTYTGYDGDFQYKHNFYTLVGSLQTPLISQNILNTASWMYSKTVMDLSLGLNAIRPLIQSNQDISSYLSDEVVLKFSDNLSWENGLQLYNINLNEKADGLGTDSENIHMDILNQNVAINSVYSQVKWSPFSGSHFNLGLRGENVILPSSRYFELLPRISYTLDIDEKTKIKVYTGKYSQHHFSITNVDTSGNYSLPNTQSDRAYHYGTGVETYLSDEVLLKADIFYKTYDNLAITSVNSYTVGSTTIYSNQYTNEGIGNAYGIELMLHRLSGKDYTGWLTYTFSKTQRKDYDAWYSPEYDKTHMANGYLDYNMSTENHILSSLTYSTGKPYTPYAQEHMSARLPDYFRLDVWIEKQGIELVCPIPFLPADDYFLNIFPIYKLNGKMYYGIFNITNHLNFKSYSWDSTNNKAVFAYDFPFMPIFGVKIEF